MKSPVTNISVIICTYTETRWADLLAAVDSVQRQTDQPQEVILVVDHNPTLLARVRDHVPGVMPVENQGPRGLSGARNSGLAVAHGDIVVFLDEDATAAPDWLAQLRAAYADPAVIGVGGSIEPAWDEGRPGWFPAEFDWVVGCTYRGLPPDPAPVRNLIGCNMSFRRQVFTTGDRFRSDMGRVGTRPVGCEETEFCIRAGRHWPERRLWYQPQAQVYHRVPPARATWRYFLARCYAEGLSKARVARLAGAGMGLASERRYILRTLPHGIWRGLIDTFRRQDLMGLARAAAITLGLAFTTAGFLAGTILEKSNQIKEQVAKMSLLLTRARSTPPLAESPFQPTQMLEVELSRPLPAVTTSDARTGQHYQQALSLVRLHATPLGLVDLSLSEDGLSPGEYAHRIWTALAPEIKAHLAEDGWPAPTRLTAAGLPAGAAPACERDRTRLLAKAPSVTVVVATHDRPENLAVCLDSLLQLDYPTYDIIVVDNAPSTTATAEFIEQTYGHVERVHYIREDRPGLAAAHNRGLREVSAELVAFTDDDVVVDSRWLTELVRGFEAGERVACVTGLILPVEIETQAQAWIEEYGGFGKGFARRVYDLSDNRPAGSLYPYTAGQFGSGANMAFRTAMLRAGGGFDPALGAGTAALGGDDLAAFFQIVTAGYQLVYQPAALLYHRHRQNYAGLRRQAFGYGVGLTAFLTKTVVDKPGRIFGLAVKIPAGLSYLFRAQSPKNRRKRANYPPQLTRIERVGMLYGPIAYGRSRLAQPERPVHSASPVTTATTLRQEVTQP